MLNSNPRDTSLHR